MGNINVYLYNDQELSDIDPQYYDEVLGQYKEHTEHFDSEDYRTYVIYDCVCIKYPQRTHKLNEAHFKKTKQRRMPRGLEIGLFCRPEGMGKNTWLGHIDTYFDKLVGLNKKKYLLTYMDDGLEKIGQREFNAYGDKILGRDYFERMKYLPYEAYNDWDPEYNIPISMWDNGELRVVKLGKLGEILSSSDPRLRLDVQPTLTYDKNSVDKIKESKRARELTGFVTTRWTNEDKQFKRDTWDNSLADNIHDIVAEWAPIFKGKKHGDYAAPDKWYRVAADDHRESPFANDYFEENKLSAKQLKFMMGVVQAQSQHMVNLRRLKKAEKAVAKMVRDNKKKEEEKWRQEEKKRKRAPSPTEGSNSNPGTSSNPIDLTMYLKF